MFERRRKLKNHLVFCLFALFLGGVAGVVVWAFFLLMNGGLTLFWTVLPSVFGNPVWYPVAVCLVGGLIIGFWQKKFGEYPETLYAVMAKVSKTHWIAYDKIWVIFIAALLPLIFGGCIGPEAGLTGAIAGLCSWMGDHFKYAAKQTRELGKIGASATLGVVFGAAPLLGLLSPIDMTDEDGRTVIPRFSKILVYGFGVLGSIVSYALCNLLLPAGLGLPRFEAVHAAAWTDFLWMLVLALIGVAVGYLYHLFAKLVGLAMRVFRGARVVKALVGGLILGVVGIFLPYTMFAGETQMEEVVTKWSEMGFVLLLVTGVVKLLIGQICIQSGWRGGNIFPIVFSGVCIGFAASFFIPVDPMICMTVVTAAVSGCVIRKPVLVVLVLFLCYPPSLILQLLIGALVGSFVPLPKCLGGTPREWRKKKPHLSEKTDD